MEECFLCEQLVLLDQFVFPPNCLLLLYQMVFIIRLLSLLCEDQQMNERALLSWREP